MSEPSPDDAFYLPEGDLPGGGETFVATPWTRGPWDVRMQHGGPPSALLARAIDRALGDDHAAWVPARSMVELLRPVPIARLGVRAELEHRGRQAIRARAVIEHEGHEIARLRAVLLRAQPDAPELARSVAHDPLPPPEGWPRFGFPFFLDPVGYHVAMDVRLGDPWPGPRCRAWSRMVVPLVQGETPDGWQRALCFADAAHGVAPGLDPSRFSIVNPDLELTLARRPRGEWVALDVTTRTGANGVGMTRSRVLDADGEAGAASATLVVRARG